MLSPSAPNGTKPISMRRRDSFSQASDPKATATVNTVRISVTTVGPPARCTRAKFGICARYTPPSSQNQEMPSMERNTLRCSLANLMRRKVSVMGFHPIG